MKVDADLKGAHLDLERSIFTHDQLRDQRFPCNPNMASVRILIP